MAIRFPIAMIFGLATYMIAMMMTVYDGALSMIFQPIAGTILTAIACIAISIIASPLFITRVWLVWRRMWVLSLFMFFAGILAMILSWHTALRIQVWNPQLQMQVESFHPVLSLGGWVTMLFGILWLPKIAITRDARWI
jgi:hypothetical protein